MSKTRRPGGCNVCGQDWFGCGCEISPCKLCGGPRDRCSLENDDLYEGRCGECMLKAGLIKRLSPNRTPPPPLNDEEIDRLRQAVAALAPGWEVYQESGAAAEASIWHVGLNYCLASLRHLPGNNEGPVGLEPAVALVICVWLNLGPRLLAEYLALKAKPPS
jgi:hypothetical protein